MRRIFLIVCSIFTAILMISTVSAVPKVNSESLMNRIDEIEEYKKLIDKEINDIILDVGNGGLIDFFIQIIQWLIDLVWQIINVVYQIFGILDLVESLISVINYLFELIMDLIDAIMDIFTPNII